MFEKIFKRKNTILLHFNAPLLDERIRYLQYWKKNGAVDVTLRRMAHIVLSVAKSLNLKGKKLVTITEINEAANKWDKQRRRNGANRFGTITKSSYIHHARFWLISINRLKDTIDYKTSFSPQLHQYITHLRSEKGLSETTISVWIRFLIQFFLFIEKSIHSLAELNIALIDKMLKKKHFEDGCNRITMRCYASILRAFLIFAEAHKWCRLGLSASIQRIRVYEHESLPEGPHWADVQKMVEQTVGNDSINIRDRAILFLLAVYGLRLSEIINLKLDDFDWEKEVFYVRGRKNSQTLKLPITKSTGNVIQRYIRYVRPNGCSHREVFVGPRAPHAPIGKRTVYNLVSKRLKSLGITLKNYGPHSLRHACATHLINEEIPLKQISDHLGHRSLDTTRIYAKVNLASLRKVAEFDLRKIL